MDAAQQILDLARSPQAAQWVESLGAGERAQAASVLKQALVDNELAGSYTTPDLTAAYQRLGGSEADLDQAVVSEAAVLQERGALPPAGTAVVWSRLIRVQDSLSEAEVRSWLHDDMMRALAAKATSWTRFSAIVLGDWARAQDATSTETSLAQYLITRHPNESAAVLAQAMRENPTGAERLADRIEAGSPRTLTTLAAAVVDDGSIPAGLRVALAGRGNEDVRARARAMVARELGVTDEALVRLAPEQEDDQSDPVQDADGATPAALRLAWITAGAVLLLTGILPFGFQFSFVLALLAFVIAYFIGREPGGD